MANSTSDMSQYPDKTRATRLAQFPQHHRIILETLLVPRELPYSELSQKALNSGNPITQLQFDNAINELVRQGYLMSFLEDGEVYYLLEVDLKPDKHDEVAQRSSRPDIFLDNLKD